MRHGLLTFCWSGEPLQEILRQFGMLAIAADHIARARRLWRVPDQPATDLHPWHETAELLSFNFALRTGIPVAHDRWRGHHREGLSVGPGSINLRCAPALN